MEDIHITIAERITTLLQILNMALAYIFVLGISLDNTQPIKFKTQQRRAISFTRYTLITIKSFFLSRFFTCLHARYFIDNY